LFFPNVSSKVVVQLHTQVILQLHYNVYSINNKQYQCTYIALFQDFHNIALDELTLEVADNIYLKINEYQPSLPPTNPTYCPVLSGYLSLIRQPQQLGITMFHPR
jgi:hypothetical protein